MFFHLGNFLVIRCQKEAKGRKRDILRRRHHSACGLFRVNCLMSCYLLAATVSMRNSPQIPATGAKVHQAFEFDSAALTAMSKNSHSNKALCVCPMKKIIGTNTCHHWNWFYIMFKFHACCFIMKVLKHKTLYFTAWICDSLMLGKWKQCSEVQATSVALL